MTDMTVVRIADERVLDTVYALLPEGMDLTREDDFVQAGALLVEQINACTLALGELLAWKLVQEHAGNDASRDRVFARYAHAWGTSRTTLIKAWVLATRFPEVPRPEDVDRTTAYEVLAGSETPEQAEAGMQAVAALGLSAEKVREAKLLHKEGLSAPTDWQVPYFFRRGDDVWARQDGEEVLVWKASNQDRELARRAQLVARRRLHI